MTAPVDIPIAPLPLTPQQLAVIRQFAPAAPAAPEATRTAPPRVVVKPVRDSRLEALLALYRPYKDAREQAEGQFKELTEGIRAELEALYPEEQRPAEAYEIPASPMWPQLTFAYKESRQLAVKQVRELLPQVYDAFHTVRSWWELRESATGRTRTRGKRP